MAAPLIAAGVAIAARIAAKKAAQEAAKRLIPTAIKTSNKNYKIKKTVSGKIKVTDTAKKTSVKLPKNANITIQNIKKAKADKYIKNANTKEFAKNRAKEVAKLAGAGIATGAFTQIPEVKQSIKRQIKEANKNKKPAKKPSTKKK